jgi:beta-1,2-mannobiose phosphorylase / 1,2-beta-oligomannan phosphorylase
MKLIKRCFDNPVIVPESDIPWESEGAFNGSAARYKDMTHMVYRAQSKPLYHKSGDWIALCSIGHAVSSDGVHFKNHRLLLSPTEKWERYGVEDPRVTKLGSTYYIFYTALSTFPFGADGIKVAVGLTKDFKTITERYLVTPFNAKAAALFPRKINGKFAMILTANTDLPPGKIAVAFFDKEEEMWNHELWQEWYENLDDHTITLQRRPEDHVEFGAPPVWTKDGWVIFYSYIQNYHTDHPLFTIEAALLDLKDPRRVIGHTVAPLLVPEEEYEEYGQIKDIVFPSGIVVRGDHYSLYYGAADTTTCLATGSMKVLLKELTTKSEKRVHFERAPKNPILTPILTNAWEAKAVLNPAAVAVGETVRILYRACSEDDTSTLGYAESKNGLKISRRDKEPVYVPRAEFEMKKNGGNSGCEDPRITKMGDTYYMMYTAVDTANPPRVALTTISEKDFDARRFERFSEPVLISPPGIDDKDACLFPEKIGGKYVVLHRIQPSIDINYFDELNFDGETKFLTHQPFIFPRRGMWDSAKIGINTVPLKTKAGWLVFYHGVSEEDKGYRVGALLLDLKKPEIVLGRSRLPLISPEMDYERIGVVPNVVFPCGAVLKKGKIYLYYGGADRVVGVATLTLASLLKDLTQA